MILKTPLTKKPTISRIWLTFVLRHEKRTLCEYLATLVAADGLKY